MVTAIERESEHTTSDGAARAATRVCEVQRPIVLIVDRDLESAKQCAKVIRRMCNNVRIEVAANGFAGLAMIAEYNPKFVVAELDLPHFSGLAMIEILAADPTFCDTRVIALGTGPTLSSKALPGHVKWLRKPLKEQDLISFLIQ